MVIFWFALFISSLWGLQSQPLLLPTATSTSTLYTLLWWVLLVGLGAYCVRVPLLCPLNHLAIQAGRILVRALLATKRKLKWLLRPWSKLDSRIRLFITVWCLLPITPGCPGISQLERVGSAPLEIKNTFPGHLFLAKLPPLTSFPVVIGSLRLRGL